jgi:hypothetical protein
VRSARAAVEVPLEPEQARALWTDLGRWASFVEGFGHVVEKRGEWPGEGAAVVWQSGPGGRGRVTEKVLVSGPDGFHVRVSEQALHGEQRVSFEPLNGGTQVELALEYELTRRGPLRRLTDALFIRRALRDAMRRTLRRYAVEAEEEAEGD